MFTALFLSKIFVSFVLINYTIVDTLFYLKHYIYHSWYFIHHKCLVDSASSSQTLLFLSTNLFIIFSEPTASLWPPDSITYTVQGSRYGCSFQVLLCHVLFFLYLFIDFCFSFDFPWKSSFTFSFLNFSIFICLTFPLTFLVLHHLIYKANLLVIRSDKPPPNPMIKRTFGILPAIFFLPETLQSYSYPLVISVFIPPILWHSLELKISICKTNVHQLAHSTVPSRVSVSSDIQCLSTHYFVFYSVFHLCINIANHDELLPWSHFLNFSLK